MTLQIWQMFDRSAAAGYFHDESAVLCCSDSNFLRSYSL